MSFIVEILNTSDNSTWIKAGQLGSSECTCSVYEKINEDYSIALNYVIPPDGQGFDKSEYLLSINARLRLVDLSGQYESKTFHIEKHSFQRNQSGQLLLNVTGTYIAFVAMRNQVIDAQYDFQNMTASEIFEILETNHSADGWEVGVCSWTLPLSLFIGWETYLSAFQKIIKAAGAEFEFIETSKNITVYAQRGDEYKNIIIRPDRNLKSISLQKYSRDVVNHVFGVGGKEPAITIAGSRHPVYSVVGQVVTLDHNKCVAENDSLNTEYKIKFVTGALAGSLFTITDCVHGANRDTLTVSGDISTAATGDKIVITDLSGVEVNYIHSAASIAIHDRIKSVYQNTQYGDTVNLIEKAFLDGSYSDGLCEGWTKYGSPTCSENTDRTYIQYGSKSQKIIGVDQYDGIYQNISGLTVGKYYRIRANIYLEGSDPVSKINIYLGTASPVAIYPSAIESDATGKWVSFDWWGQAGAETTRITVCQDGDQAATFYVDAVQFAECAVNENQNYTSNCEQLDLWKETFDQLARSKDVLVEYQCNFIDLNKMDRIKYPYDKINLGDGVLISDNRLGIVNMPARVKELKFDPFHPESTEHTVSNYE
jgi:hypothetical protein